MLINRKYLQRIIDVTANVAPGKDLGTASAAVEKALDELRAAGRLLRAASAARPQAQKEAFAGLALRRR